MKPLTPLTEAALLVLKEHGKGEADCASTRANEMKAIGDFDLERFWLAVLQKIERIHLFGKDPGDANSKQVPSL